jgi:hypothetical protein
VGKTASRRRGACIKVPPAASVATARMGGRLVGYAVDASFRGGGGWLPVSAIAASDDWWVTAFYAVRDPHVGERSSTLRLRSVRARTAPCGYLSFSNQLTVSF